jgi:endogenous inhibitor of DNA gyrase (YacG/DUF329 family)
MPKNLEKRPCPYCRKPALWNKNPWRPFCSERCKMTDLGLWAGGDYRIAGEKIAPDAIVPEGENIPPK